MARATTLCQTPCPYLANQVSEKPVGHLAIFASSYLPTKGVSQFRHEVKG